MRNTQFLTGRRGFTTLALIAPVLLLASSCGDTNAPLDNNLRTTVLVAGADHPDFFLVLAGNEGKQRVAPQVPTYRHVSPGVHAVRIESLPSNCLVQQPQSVDVTIRPNEIASVEFRVECRAVTAVISVTAPIIGRDGTHDGYPVGVTGGTGPALGGTIYTTVAATFSVPAGKYTVTFQGELRENCQLTGPATQNVSVTVGAPIKDTAAVAFPLQCAARTGDVRLVARTTGGDLDADGYSIWIDGIEQWIGDWDFAELVRLPPNGNQLFAEMSPGDHELKIAEVAPNCAVVGGNPRTVTVGVGAVSESVFEVQCTDLP